VGLTACRGSGGSDLIGATLFGLEAMGLAAIGLEAAVRRRSMGNGRDTLIERGTFGLAVGGRVDDALTGRVDD